MRRTLFGNCTPFFILGAAKCGTTSLYHFLNQHPSVHFSDPKEPIFFEAEYEEGLEYYRKKYYEKWEEGGAVGEARPANLFLPYVPRRIHNSFPGAKLIIILRNPVDRAYSHWWMRKTQGREELSFQEATRKNRQRLRRGHTLEGKGGEKLWRKSLVPGTGMVELRTYLDMGYYAAQVERYLDLFPRDRIKIILLRDLSKTTEKVTRDLFEFLGVDETAEVSDFEKKNAALSPTAAAFFRVARKTQAGKVLYDGIKDKIKKLLSRFGSKPYMSSSYRSKLDNHYYQYNKKLEKIAQKDLSHWN